MLKLALTASKHIHVDVFIDRDRKRSWAAQVSHGNQKRVEAEVRVRLREVLREMRRERGSGSQCPHIEGDG